MVDGEHVREWIAAECSEGFERTWILLTALWTLLASPPVSSRSVSPADTSKYILNDTKSISQGDTWILMLIAMLFIITKIWKQICVPTMDEWMICYIYSGTVFIHE